MVEVPRLSVQEARRRVTAGQALLVCAYPDEAKCNQVRLEGSITLSELQARRAALPKDQELIFHCA